MEITVITSQEAREAAADVLYKHGANGLVIEDSMPVTLQDDVEGYADILEEAYPPEEVRLMAYLPVDEQLAKTVESLRQEVAALGDFGLDPGRAEVKLMEVEDDDWATAWKAYYKPIPVGQRLMIKPTWEEVSPQEERIIIELDPGMAFGTGTHQTTTMCMEALESIMQGGESVIDVGCGSGILSIVAAKLGARSVQGLDYDQVAVDVTTRNVELNHVQSLVSVKKSNLLQAAEGKVDIIVANIIARIIIDMIPSLDAHLLPGGQFLASGIIRDRSDDIKQALSEHGFAVEREMHDGEWVTLLALRR